MTDRRQFLQTAAVLSAAPLASRAVFAGGREFGLLEAVVVDTRHGEAFAFGERAQTMGVPVRPIEGDITDLWSQVLLPRWRSGPVALAGMTERPALFLLERLGWDHGLRVVFEAEHGPDGLGGIMHSVVRSADAALAPALAAAGSRWTAVLADAMFAGNRAATRDFRPSGAAMAARRDEPTRLHSWIIAPRTAA